MQNTTRVALLLLLASTAMAGFEGGCGQTPPQPLPPVPNPPPPPAECVDLLDEAACNAASACRAIYVEVACACAACEGPGCPPCECPPPARNFVGCEDRSGCDGLDEAACSADTACEPIYATPACLEAPEEPAPCIAPGPGCGGGCSEEPSYAGCRDRVECPLILCAPCEYGTVVDQNGCATCECTPPSDPCTGLPEDVCIATPGCDPAYGGGAEDTGRAAPAPPCDCFGPGCNCPGDPPAEYAGCVQVPERCEDITDENVCAMTRGCHPEYLATPCAGICPEGDPNCGGGDQRPECPPAFYRCAPDDTKPECFSDFDCRGGYCDYGVSSGGAAPAPDDTEPGAPRDEVPVEPVPPPGGSCVYPSCGDGQPILCDAIPPACGVGQVLGGLNGCWSCFDARSCTPVSPPTDCSSDYDCPGGYCADGSGTAPGGGAEPPPPDEDPGAFRPAPPPGGQCVYPVCGDGSATACDAIAPVCGVGQVAGQWNGCWACFDARTCLPVEQPVECFSDAECPDGYCEQGPNSSSGGGAAEDRAAPAPPPPPGGQCVSVSCGDGSVLACRMARPVCAPGETAAVVNSCWECLDARTCSAAPGCDPATTDCG